MQATKKNAKNLVEGGGDTRGFVAPVGSVVQKPAAASAAVFLWMHVNVYTNIA